jgi:SAM-dependent methyltransferase
VNATTTCPCGATQARVALDTGGVLPKRHLVLECLRCRLRRPDEVPPEDEVGRTYDGYGRYADPAWLADELGRRRGPAERLRRKLERALAPAPLAGRFLEVGCASGGLLRNLARVAPLECWGVELDPISARLAAEWLPDRITTGSLEDARFPSDHFTVAYLEQVIENVADTTSLMRELRRVLRPGGLLLLGTPNFRGVAARLLGARWKEMVPSHHVRMFCPASLRWHLGANGFIDVRVRTAGLWLLEHDGRDRLPISRDGIPARLLGRGLGALRLGDLLSATARKA